MGNIKFSCCYCDKQFQTGASLRSHKSHCLKNPNLKKRLVSDSSRNFKGRNFEPNCVCSCSFCNRVFSRKSAKTLHEKSCRKNPNWIKGHTTILSEEAKKKISDSMKKAHLEGRAGSFPSRKNCEHSYPEKWLIGVLERELGLIENKDYETEYYFHKQFLDFAFPERKLCIEVDGEQHERFEDRKLMDAKKEENLKAEHWKLLRLKWSNVCNDTQFYVQQILDFLK